MRIALYGEIPGDLLFFIQTLPAFFYLFGFATLVALWLTWKYLMEHLIFHRADIYAGAFLSKLETEKSPLLKGSDEIYRLKTRKLKTFLIITLSIIFITLTIFYIIVFVYNGEPFEIDIRSLYLGGKIFLRFYVILISS
jgi:hypothetical protein